MQEASGTTMTDVSGNGRDGSYGGAVTFGTTGPVGNRAAIFPGGSGSHASVALNLSAYSAVTLSFWLWWNAFANDDALAFEFNSNYGQSPGGFYVDPNGSTGPGWELGTNAPHPTVDAASFPRPSAQEWHHYGVVMDLSRAGGAATFDFLIDGVAQTGSTMLSSNGSGTFPSTTLFFMSRNASSLRGVGRMAYVGVYGTALSADRIRSHYQAGLRSGTSY
jgi:hypothetical protein